MALTEAEELELLELENEDAGDGVRDAVGQPQQGGVWDALTTTDLEGASSLDPFAQTARLGQFANKGNQDLAGIIAERGGQAAAGEPSLQIPVPSFLAGGQSGQNIDIGAIPSVAAAGALGTASQFLVPQSRLGVAAYAVSPLMKGYQALREPVTGVQKPGMIAQLGSARTKVPAGDIQQAIDDPSVWDAPTVEAGNKAYGEAAGPLKGVARSLRQQTGKVLLGEADYAEAINKPGRILAGTEFVESAPGGMMHGPTFALDSAGNKIPVKMDSQTALEGIQSINRFTRNKANTAKLDKEQMGELLRQKDALLTFLENNGTPGMREAASVLRKAHVKENLGRIMPQNKFGGTDALRTMGSGATAAGAASLALAGHPIAAIPLALEAVTASPAFLGGAIRNYQSISNPAVMGLAGQAVNAAQNIHPTYRVQSKLADAYARQPR